MKDKALILGSAPNSVLLGGENLNDYHKIAINKSWRLRRDFDTHVFLRSLPEEQHPPISAGMRRVGVGEFTPVLRGAGGLYLTSGSVAMIAGYWAVATQGISFLSYYGCDLVFPGGPNSQTHYYGTGDAGPLVGNFEYNLRQRERSIRLLCWGLMHGVVVTNASALDGTVLAFPKCPLHLESRALLDDILSSRETLRLVRKTANVWTHEMASRTPAFRERQKVFESDPEALQAMHDILDAWQNLEPFVRDYAGRVEALFEAAGAVGSSGRLATPSQQLDKAASDYELVLHVGPNTSAANRLHRYLEALSKGSEGCKLVPIRELERYYTKISATLSGTVAGDVSAESRNVKLAQNFAKRLFEQMNVAPGGRVVIDEPAALGNIANCAYSGHLFRSPNRLLSSFAANLPVEPRDVHVSITSYADFFSRAYVKFLGSTQPERFVTPQVMVAKIMTNGPSWLTMLEGVALCFPYSRIHVWCVDHMTETVPKMAEVISDCMLGGAAFSTKIASNDDAVTADHISAFRSALCQSGTAAALDAWPQIQLQRLRNISSKGFNPFSAVQRMHLDKLYSQDLAAIEADDRFVLHGKFVNEPREDA